MAAVRGSGGGDCTESVPDSGTSRRNPPPPPADGDDDVPLIIRAIKAICVRAIMVRLRFKYGDLDMRLKVEACVPAIMSMAGICPPPP